MKPLPTAYLIGVVEKNRRGRRVLNCNLVPPRSRGAHNSPCRDQILFEYLAPCRKTGT